MRMRPRSEHHKQSNEPPYEAKTGQILRTDQCASANVRLASAWPCSSALTQ
jgi:hypothetical protein